MARNLAFERVNGFLSWNILFFCEESWNILYRTCSNELLDACLFSFVYVLRPCFLTTDKCSAQSRVSRYQPSQTLCGGWMPIDQPWPSRWQLRRMFGGLWTWRGPYAFCVYFIIKRQAPPHQVAMNLMDRHNPARERHLQMEGRHRRRPSDDDWLPLGRHHTLIC